MSVSLNDSCRSWLAIANNADVIDAPEGFGHPLFDLARRVGMAPGHLHDACRLFQKLRTKMRADSGNDCGERSVLNLDSLNASQNIFAHNSPSMENVTNPNDWRNFADKSQSPSSAPSSSQAVDEESRDAPPLSVSA